MKQREKKFKLSRRQFIKTTGVSCAAVLIAGSLPSLLNPAFGQTDNRNRKIADVIETKNINSILKKHFGNRKINMSNVNLKAPIIAENGAVVPLTVVSDLPMEEGNYVKKIYIFVDVNFNPYIASVDLTPANGKPEVAMRIKMRKTSNVRAIVEMSDGRLYGDLKSIKVTIGGCGGI